MWELLNVEGGYFWVMLGVILLILEAIFGYATFALASLGVGAIITGLAAFFGWLSFSWLLGVFGVLSVILFLVSRPLTHKLLSRSSDTPTNVEAMIGKIGVVTEAIGARSESGYVKLAGDSWRSRSVGGPLSEGTEVEVVKLEGSTLYVKEHNTVEEDA